MNKLTFNLVSNNKRLPGGLTVKTYCLRIRDNGKVIDYNLTLGQVISLEKDIKFIFKPI